MRVDMRLGSLKEKFKVKVFNGAQGAPYAACKMLASITPPPLVGGGWGEGDRFKQGAAISPPPQPPPSRGREKNLQPLVR
jgi:hypothetical protein